MMKAVQSITNKLCWYEKEMKVLGLSFDLVMITKDNRVYALLLLV